MSWTITEIDAPFDKTMVNYDAFCIMAKIKINDKFPFKTGALKSQTHIENINNGYRIVVPETPIGPQNPRNKPYTRFLDSGTTRHAIPNSFGKGYEFGAVEEKPVHSHFRKFVPEKKKYVYVFHPGSTKHMNFIKNIVLKSALDYYRAKAKYVQKLH